MASSYFGSTLTDLQSGITAGERNTGDTERAKVAADATKMSAYFNMLSNKAKTDADRHANEAANARQYFALNMEDAQKKAALSQSASQQALQWGQQAQMAKDTLAAQERMGLADNATRVEVAKAGGQIPALEVAKFKEAAQLKADTIQAQQEAQAAAALAGQANMLLQPIKAQYAKTQGDAAKATQGSIYKWLPGKKSSTNDSVEAVHEKVLGDAGRKSESEFMNGVSGILSNLNKNGLAIKFNERANRFEPAITTAATNSVRMIPAVTAAPVAVPVGVPVGLNAPVEDELGMVDSMRYFARPGQPSSQPVIQASPAQTIIRVTSGGRRAIFDAATKQFIRYAD